jgi:hypothetical protein
MAPRFLNLLFKTSEPHLDNDTASKSNSPKKTINPLLMGRHKIEALYLYLSAATHTIEFIDYKKKILNELTILNSNISLYLLVPAKKSGIQIDIEVVTNLFKRHNSLVRIIRFEIDRFSGALDTQDGLITTEAARVKMISVVEVHIAQLEKIWRALERFERRVFSF